MPGDAISIRYTYRFASEPSLKFEVKLEPRELRLLPEPREHLPEWTRLGFEQCSNCPLSTDDTERCPAAVSIVDLVEALGHRTSHERVEVLVETPDRSYAKEVDLQQGAGPLLGLCMSTSGCPILARLRPMVVTHLPFMSAREATFRMVSAYLAGQYFRKRHGREPDWELAGLTAYFDEVQLVNEAFAKRLRAASESDAAVNAVVVLNNLTSWTGTALAFDDLSDLEPLFESLLD